MLGTCSDRSLPDRRYYADGEGEQEVEQGTIRVRGDPPGCRRQAPRPHGHGRLHALLPVGQVNRDDDQIPGTRCPAPHAELLHVLMLPDFDRADRIGEFWGYPESRAFAELLIDCEEDRTLRAVLVGMLREAER
jgi:hypothetical protein